ncbi:MULTISPECIES: hypothetical protein [unclassified Bradyrhizobium]|uniref:hypothetical protein n=1 Tax=unclassified Bradyrhizobium TaxID=2631580 RepID=UPI0028ECC032|nr:MULTISPECIES: hypothetical protein [unclassified Bradyrhizobium]
MSRRNNEPLSDRVARVAEALLADQHYVSVADLFCGLGWLDASLLEQWRRGQVGSLEEVTRSGLPRIQGAEPERDRLCRTDAKPAAAAVQPQQ